MKIESDPRNPGPQDGSGAFDTLRFHLNFLNPQYSHSHLNQKSKWGAQLKVRPINFIDALYINWQGKGHRTVAWAPESPYDQKGRGLVIEYDAKSGRVFGYIFSKRPKIGKPNVRLE